MAASMGMKALGPTTPGTGSLAMSVVWPRLPNEQIDMILEFAVPDRLELQRNVYVDETQRLFGTSTRPAGTLTAVIVEPWNRLLALLSLTHHSRRFTLAALKDSQVVLDITNPYGCHHDEEFSDAPHPLPTRLQARTPSNQLLEYFGCVMIEEAAVVRLPSDPALRPLVPVHPAAIKFVATFMVPRVGETVPEPFFDWFNLPDGKLDVSDQRVRTCMEIAKKNLEAFYCDIFDDDDYTPFVYDHGSGGCLAQNAIDVCGGPRGWLQAIQNFAIDAVDSIFLDDPSYTIVSHENLPDEKRDSTLPSLESILAEEARVREQKEAEEAKEREEKELKQAWQF